MKCPVCNIDLVMSERSGVEIDYCPQCRGIWLDRGELDKIIERSEVYPSINNQEKSSSQNNHESFFGNDKYIKNDQKITQKKKESFLSDLFDF